MISKHHVQNILDRSITELTTNGEYYILTTILPNKFCIVECGETPSICIQATKNKIRELESYLERDKEFYGYDLGNEFE